MEVDLGPAIASLLEYLVLVEPASGANHHQFQMTQRGKLDEFESYVHRLHGLQKVEVLVVRDGSSLIKETS